MIELEYIKYVALVIAVGGVWMFQDAVASILFYLGRDDEKWHFNHLVRVLRAVWGLGFIVAGVLLL